MVHRNSLSAFSPARANSACRNPLSKAAFNVQSRRIVDGLCQGRPLARVLAAAIDDWANAIGDQ